MFKENDDMRPASTPERVLAICRLIEYGNDSYITQDLYKLCALNEQAKSTEEICDYIWAAIELGFIEKSGDKNKLNSGDKYKLKINGKDLESPISFRKAVSSAAFLNRESTFFRLTSWYIKHTDEIKWINSFKSFAMAAAKAKDGVSSINENGVLGWRFWIRWLGIAYQYKGTLIPNMQTRLEDAFELGKVPRGTRMTCSQFVSWLKANVPEAAEACTEQSLPLAISNGLRVLNSEKKIELISTMDSVHTSLSYIDGAELNDFSEIVIMESEA